MTRRKAPLEEEPLTRREERARRRAIRLDWTERTVAAPERAQPISAAPSTPKAPRPDDVHLSAEEYADLVKAGRPKAKKAK